MVVPNAKAGARRLSSPQTAHGNASARRTLVVCCAEHFVHDA
jgi:hypothetical protein